MVVGLGNPGEEYAETRHNAGFLLCDHLAARWGAGDFRKGIDCRQTTVRVGEQAVTLVKPTTYMNRSGAALVPFRGRPDFDPAQHLLVLVDDVATPLGRFRLRGAGSAGGHNGLKSIEGTLRRQDYARLRIGVGEKPPEYDDLADWVLGRFAKAERAILTDLLDRMADAVETWLAQGIERAMSQHNRP